jgi:hypothetical protein
LDHSLTRYLDDGTLPHDDNHVENRIRSIAVGRSNVVLPDHCTPDSAPPPR